MPWQPQITYWVLYLSRVFSNFWKCKKKSTIYHSSVESQYRAMAKTCCELQWLVNLLFNLQISHSQPSLLFCDNKVVLHIAVNPTFHEQTKHIELDYHFVHEKIQSKLIYPLHVSSEHQLSDLFAKQFGFSQFSYLLSKMGVLDLHTPYLGWGGGWWVILAPV